MALMHWRTTVSRARKHSLLLLSRGLHSGLTSPQIVFAIIKGIVGPAILYIPHGFLEGGYGNS